MKKDVIIILFNNFETLDVFGPVEIFGRLNEYFNLHFYSIKGGIIESSHKVKVVTKSLINIDLKNFILLIPGGVGTRKLVSDKKFVEALNDMAGKAQYILTVCTGSVLFSKTGLLDNKKATSNKRAFVWTLKESPEVNWIKKAT